MYTVRIQSLIAIATEILTLFSRYIGALKYGIFGLIDSQTISPSQAWTKLPISDCIFSPQLDNLGPVTDLTLKPVVHKTVGSLLVLWHCF